jgi:hypothetical protein
MKQTLYPLILALLLVALIGAACESLSPKYQQARRLAETTVTHEGTYAFDGDSATLKLTKYQTLSTPDTWTFTYRYDSKHAGYGDRTGQLLAQVITSHTAVITVQQGKVTAAVLDGKWDMILQQPIG